MFKMPKYYYNTNNPILGTIIGVFVILFIYSCLFALNTFILYNYLIFVHMEGRIIDIYNRVTADAKYFFVPMDNELSSRYLRWVVSKMRAANKNVQTRVLAKQAAITYNSVSDRDRGFKRDVTYIAIYRSCKSLFLIHRQRGQTRPLSPLCQDRRRRPLRARGGFALHRR